MTRQDKIDYRREWARQRRGESYSYINKYKSDNGCTDCGETDWRVLEFDHLRDKFMDVSKMVARCFTLDKIREEIEKCEVVCANCHRIRGFNRRHGEGG